MVEPWVLAQGFINNLQQQAAQNQNTADNVLMRMMGAGVNRADMATQQGYGLDTLAKRNEYAVQGDTVAFDRQLQRDKAVFDQQNQRLQQSRAWDVEDFGKRRDNLILEQRLQAEREAARGEYPAAGQRRHGSGGDIFNRFMSTVKAGGINNPYALAAIAATGERESGFSPGNTYGTWSDPSESGAPGQAGGVMSWRAERYANLQRFAAAQGENPNQISPETQAKFLLSENPELIARLNAAKSPDEAQYLMNEAWKFAGYNRPSPEAAARLTAARRYASQFGGEGGGDFPTSTGRNGDFVSDAETAILGLPVPNSAASGGRFGDAGQVADVSPELKQYLDANGKEFVRRIRLTEAQRDLLPEDFQKTLVPDIGDTSQMNKKGPTEYIVTRQREIQEPAMTGLPKPNTTSAAPVTVQKGARVKYVDGKRQTVLDDGTEIVLPD